MTVPDLVWHLLSRGYRLGVAGQLPQAKSTRRRRRAQPYRPRSLLLDQSHACGQPSHVLQFPRDFWFNEVNYFKFVPQSLSVVLRKEENSKQCRALPRVVAYPPKHS